MLRLWKEVRRRMNNFVENLKRELRNAELINKVVKEEKVIKAIEELESCCLNNKPTMEEIFGSKYAFNGEL